MCGRYVLKHTLNQLFDIYNVNSSDSFEFNPIYNVAPTFDMPVLKMNGEKKLEPYRWGLLPFWAKDEKLSYKLINARSETISEKPSFREAFKKRRCVVPASGFYEWKKDSNSKVPHYIYPSDGSLFSFAGLYEQWKSPDGKEVNSYTIITTDANDDMSGLHDRMPAMLFGAEIDNWLSPDENSKYLQDLLRPAPDDALDYHIVSKEVNSPKNQGPGLIEKADLFS